MFFCSESISLDGHPDSLQYSPRSVLSLVTLNKEGQTEDQHMEDGGHAHSDYYWAYLSGRIHDQYKGRFSSFMSHKGINTIETDYSLLMAWHKICLLF